MIAVIKKRRHRQQKKPTYLSSISSMEVGASLNQKFLAKELAIGHHGDQSTTISIDNRTIVET